MRPSEKLAAGLINATAAGGLVLLAIGLLYGLIQVQP